MVLAAGVLCLLGAVAVLIVLTAPKEDE